MKSTKIVTGVVRRRITELACFAVGGSARYEKDTDPRDISWSEMRLGSDR